MHQATSAPDVIVSRNGRSVKDDTVRVPGFATYKLSEWLRIADWCIDVVLDACASGRRDGTAVWAKHWLHANGLDTVKKLREFIARRPLFDQPPDPSHTVCCRKCGRPLSHPVSKALGAGPECRKGA